MNQDPEEPVPHMPPCIVRRAERCGLCEGAGRLDCVKAREPRTGCAHQAPAGREKGERTEGRET
jgi:hypothetical protein